MTAESQPGRSNTLRQVFPDGDIFAVSDCEWMGIAAAHYGIRDVALADSGKLPEDANVVLFLRRHLVSTEVRKLFRRARVLVVPIASFDPGLEAALYTQKLVMLTDYSAACALGRYWVDGIKEQAGPLVFSGGDGPREEGQVAGTRPSTDLTCSFSDELSIAAWLQPAIGAGKWVSVGSYCELSLTAHPLRGEPAPFSLDGTAVASGVLVARDPRYREVGDRRIRAAQDLRRDLVASAPITLRLESGVLTEARADGHDFTEAIREVTNPAYGLQALELGIGTNLNILPEVTWNVNSQLNEGAGPLHIGFGEGITGAHMDFIMADCGHHFVSSS